jgi:hypothetical protein
VTRRRAPDGGIPAGLGGWCLCGSVYAEPRLKVTARPPQAVGRFFDRRLEFEPEAGTGRRRVLTRQRRGPPPRCPPHERLCSTAPGPSSPRAGRFRATRVRASEATFGRRVGSMAAARAPLLRMTRRSTRPARCPSRPSQSALGKTRHTRPRCIPCERKRRAGLISQGRANCDLSRVTTLERRTARRLRARAGGRLLFSVAAAQRTKRDCSPLPEIEIEGRLWLLWLRRKIKPSGVVGCR